MNGGEASTCLMVFAFLLAAIHQVDYFAGRLPWISPVYNSVPFTVNGRARQSRGAQ